MGIERNIALAVIREHAYRPIRGDVLLIGRQTMFFGPEEAVGMIEGCNLGLKAAPVSFIPESDTRASQSNYISDRDFFRLLGVERIRALDVSAYEGADIIHDLTEPLPSHLEGIADFILDGSTLDNVFDPATALRNFARLLKPGGRIVSVNMASNHYGPYLIFTPAWVLDYFAVNRFADCKAYVVVYGPEGMNAFTPDLSRMHEGLTQPDNLTSDKTMGMVFVAEKASDSTWYKTPVQHQYREEWGDFTDGIARFAASRRPEPIRSTAKRFLRNDAFFYVADDGGKHPAITNVRKSTLMRRLLHQL